MSAFEIYPLDLPEERFPEFPSIRWTKPYIEYWSPWGKSIGYNYKFHLEDMEQIRVVTFPTSPDYTYRFTKSITLVSQGIKDEVLRLSVSQVYPFKSFASLYEAVKWFSEVDLEDLSRMILT